MLDMERTSRSTKLKGIKSVIKLETIVPYASSSEIATHGEGRRHTAVRNCLMAAATKNIGVLLRT